MQTPEPTAAERPTPSTVSQPSGPAPSAVALGTAGWGGGWGVEPLSEDQWSCAEAAARTALHAALEAGITTVDTADIYAHGRSEQTLGRLLAQEPGLRERIRLQTKCGIMIGGSPLYGVGGAAAVDSTRYDGTAEHVRRAVAGSLERLGADRVDTLVIHRPDPLTPPAQTVQAYLELRQAGSVGALGLSNMGVAWVRRFDDALRAATDGAEGIACLQIELGLHHRGLVESAVLVNHPETAARAVVGEAAGLAELCAERGIALQAWGSLGQGRYTRGAEQAAERDRAAARVVEELAQTLGCSGEAVVLAWLLRLPWQVQPVVGTMDPDRLRACAEAPEAAARLSGDDWYRLWTAARGASLP